MRWRVDTIPWPLRPLWWLYGRGLGFVVWVFVRSWRATLTVRHEGGEPRPGVVYALWHGAWPIWFMLASREWPRTVMLQHPAAYMAPVHGLLTSLGVRYELGSKGAEAFAASERIARDVAAGWCTVVSPDGPAGPRERLKPGVAHLAAAAGVPVVPLTFRTPKRWFLKSWDRKWIPPPFSTVVVQHGTPVTVDAAAPTAAVPVLQAALDAS